MKTAIPATAMLLVAWLLSGCGEQIFPAKTTVTPPNVQSQASPEPATPTTTVTPTNVAATRIENVQYFPGKPEYVGYQATPVQLGKYPAIVLIHEWWGLDENVRKLARNFAERGYLVLVVDLYGKPATTDRQAAMKLAEGVTANIALAFENLGYAVQYLQSNSQVDPEKIGSVGWWYGGDWEYQLAKNGLWTRASVLYYGWWNPKADLPAIRSQILGHFEQKDISVLAESATEFQAKFKNPTGTHTIYVYPNAGHGFASDDSASYDAIATDLAQQRILDFLDKNVKTNTPNPLAQ